MDISELKDNNGTEIYRKLAFELRDEGVTEIQYIEFLNMKMPNWKESEDMAPRIHKLLDILFHTFF